MPKVSAKRQITLPVEQCKALGIEPGDFVESFVVNGQLTLVKKVSGAAKGMLGHLQVDSSISDEDSMQSSIN